MYDEQVIEELAQFLGGADTSGSNFATFNEAEANEWWPRQLTQLSRGLSPA